MHDEEIILSFKTIYFEIQGFGKNMATEVLANT